MKKILALGLVVLLVLAGCSSTSTPEQAFEKAVKGLDSAHTVDFKVSTVITTEDGDIVFDNFGKIMTEGKEEFSGQVTVKALVNKVYEDLVIFVSEGKFYVEMNDVKSVMTQEELLAMGLVDFTLINTLVSDFDEATTEGSVHTFTKATDNVDHVLKFSTYSHLTSMTLKEASMTQTLKVEKDAFTSNYIFVKSTYIAQDGTELPVTQAIQLKYSGASKVEMPDFSAFK